MPSWSIAQAEDITGHPTRRKIVLWLMTLVLVLGIHRAEGSFLGTPTGETTIGAEDHVLAYGRAPVLQELAIRQRALGDQAHADAVDEQRALLRRQGNE